MTTLAECIDTFLADMQHQRDLRPNTLAAYRCDLQMARTFLDRPLDTVTVDQVEQFIASKQAKASTRCDGYQRHPSPYFLGSN